MVTFLGKVFFGGGQVCHFYESFIKSTRKILAWVRFPPFWVTAMLGFWKRLLLQKLPNNSCLSKNLNKWITSEAAVKGRTVSFRPLSSSPSARGWQSPSPPSSCFSPHTPALWDNLKGKFHFSFVWFRWRFRLKCFCKFWGGQQSRIKWEGMFKYQFTQIYPIKKFKVLPLSAFYKFTRLKSSKSLLFTSLRQSSEQASPLSDCFHFQPWHKMYFILLKKATQPKGILV